MPRSLFAYPSEETCRDVRNPAAESRNLSKPDAPQHDHHRPHFPRPGDGFVHCGSGDVRRTGGDNLRFNVGGVFVAVLLMAALMRGTFWTQAWMAPAVYGWQLKRSLMSVTNVMHQVTATVDAGDPSAMKLLRFYHLGLSQMHQLDGNSSDHSQLIREMDLHKARMEALGIETEQTQLNPAWLDAVKQTPR